MVGCLQQRVRKAGTGADSALAMATSELPNTFLDLQGSLISELDTRLTRYKRTRLDTRRTSHMNYFSHPFFMSRSRTETRTLSLSSFSKASLTGARLTVPFGIFRFGRNSLSFSSSGRGWAISLKQFRAGICPFHSYTSTSAHFNAR